MAAEMSKDESWGKSISVGNVQSLANSTADIPEIYIRPDLDIGTEKFSEEKLPIIDMSLLLNPNFSCQECSKLDLACKQWGFFQLVNHGIDDELMEKMEGDLKEFFKLPLEEKEMFAPVTGGLQGYGKKLAVNEEKLEWHDLLFLITRPLDSKNLRFWPTHPPSFRSTLERYSEELKRVSQCLFEVIGKNLGLKTAETALLKGIDDHQGIRMHYYPPCSKASKVLGLNPHSDVGILTLLHQVGDVQALQIKRNGKWLPVQPIPHAFVVNISDVLEIWTNGKYVSVEHRVTVNNKEERVSIATHHRPKDDCMVGPLKELIQGDDQEEHYYKTVTFQEYTQIYLSGKVEGKRHMNLMRNNYN